MSDNLSVMGQQFGKLTVIEAHSTGGHGINWKCRCECGAIVTRQPSVLRRGKELSCIKCRGGIKPGDRFGALKIVRRIRVESSRAIWLCACDCGDVCERSTSHLKATPNSGCDGCFNDRRAIHGGHKTRLYRIWRAMRGRCERQSSDSYQWYGARGIRVCPGWQSFETFRDWASAHGYADDLTIDRLNPLGNYEPSNCEWVTNAENVRRGNIWNAARRADDA